jgi:isochorismate hydrolase
MRAWEKVMLDSDLKLHQKIHFGGRQEFGRRPAFLIIDVTRAFVGSSSKPAMESVEEYRTSCGQAGWDALESIQKLQQTCRARSVPVMFTTGNAYMSPFVGGPMKRSMPQKAPDPRADEIPSLIAPLPDELVIAKTRPSAFFHTPLLNCLKNMGVDCLLVGGTSTSGCVRASVVEACSHSIPVFVVEECVFDRFQMSHLVSLFDMNAKYADVITLEEALGYLAELPSPVLERA